MSEEEQRQWRGCKQWLRERAWQDYVVLIFLVTVAFYSINLTSNMKQLASPLYGGDHYFQLGSVNHILDGGNPFAGSNVIGTLPGYLPLYGMIVAYTSKFLGLEGMQGMKLFSVIFGVLGFLLLYILTAKLSDDKTTALLGFILVVNMSLLPIFKYTTFTEIMMFPLYYLCALAFLKKNTYPRAVIWGLILGLTGLSHAVGYIAAMIFFGIFVLHYLVTDYYNWNEKRVLVKKEEWKQRLKYVAVIFLLGFLIALPYWFKPIFSYGGKPSVDYTGWNSIDLSQGSNQLEFLKTTLVGTFFQFLKWGGDQTISMANLGFKGLSFILLFGLVFFILRYKKYLKIENPRTLPDRTGLVFTGILIIASVIGAFHYLITQPLLGVDFIPSYANRFLWTFMEIALVVFFIKEARKVIATIPQYAKLVYAILLLVMVVGAGAIQVYALQHFGTNQWYQNAQQDLSEQHKSLIEFMKKYTDVNDVVLTTPELGFALNGLTGRKLVVTRRAQNDAFYDFDPNFRDASVILYGKPSKETTAKKIELLKKYNIKYVYWDTYWIESEYRFDENFNIRDWFDPLIVFDTPSNRAYLGQYGVLFTPLFTWLDPTLKGPQFKQLNLLFIQPGYRSFDLPWKADLDPYLKEVWSHTSTHNGKEVKVAVLYRIDLDNPSVLPLEEPLNEKRT